MPSETTALVEVLNIVGLDVEEQPRSLRLELGLLSPLRVVLLVLGDEGDEEPVDVEGRAAWLLLASTEADGLVELGRPDEVLHVTGEPGDAVYLHGILLLGLSALALRTRNRFISSSFWTLGSWTNADPEMDNANGRVADALPTGSALGRLIGALSAEA
jgi:hypothetical protein